MRTSTAPTASCTALCDLSDDLPPRPTGELTGGLWLPGLESVAPQNEQDVWLHDALLGPHSADIVGYLTLARRTGGPVLDLGSGSGRLTVPFARHGFAVAAVDRDGPSLKRLRHWADRLGRSTSALVTTVRSDLAQLRLRQDYQLVVLAGAMITAVPPNTRRRLLRHVAAHLGSGGLLALDYPEHSMSALAEQPGRTWMFDVPRCDDVTERVVAQQTFDLAEGTEEITYYCERAVGHRTHRSKLTTHKWLVETDRLAQEIRDAGLQVDQRTPHRIDGVTEHVLLICRAAP
ncbi:class I SAM-dependent methyltransferase [Streptomyces ochraceiscleroticus]|uniref:Class I SAM-dependent methyltransferase n=1 Tax=Streptomyces ochraceiscleroticus TaxID=47761 RepID=A0ABW1MTU4_9ACTN|nr:class I SAM-dependent methyltransferase [Streptomyces ochraceiscleroticus]